MTDLSVSTDQALAEVGRLRALLAEQTREVERLREVNRRQAAGWAATHAELTDLKARVGLA